MATIVKGTTFAGTVTAGGMHTLIESATISAIDRASLRTTEITVATHLPSALPSPTANEVWQIKPSNGLASYDLANTRWTGALPTDQRYTNDPGISSAVVSGEALASFAVGALSSLVLRKAVTGDVVVAVALADCALGAASICRVAGPVKVVCTGTVNAGESVKLSSTAGAFESIGAVGSAAGLDACGVAITASSGGFVWIILRR